MSIGKRWLGVSKAAEMTDGLYCARTIRRLCESGQLKGAVRNGEAGKWRIPEQSMLDWLYRLRSGVRSGRHISKD